MNKKRLKGRFPSYPMGKINKIKNFERIAAGEVIERPASVVKELIENSIDAGASSIKVVIKNYGRDLIQVTDNGQGIEKEDLRIAFEEHTTSKIESADELLENGSITLGFRGEALASISAISNVEVVSRTSQETPAYRLSQTRGEFSEPEPTGAPLGTTIKIQNLFYNTPVRLKFLKSDQVELGHITSTISQFCLAYPEIHFQYLHNDKVLINAPRVSSTLDVILLIYGRETADQMVPIYFHDHLFKISGFMGLPTLARSSASSSHLFVNLRHVVHPPLIKLIRKAYSDFLMRNQYPFFVVFIEIDPSKVDFNIHPTKKLIRFAHEDQLLKLFARNFQQIIDEKFRESLIYKQEVKAQTTNEDEWGSEQWEGLDGLSSEDEEKIEGKEQGLMSSLNRKRQTESVRTHSKFAMENLSATSQSPHGGSRKFLPSVQSQGRPPQPSRKSLGYSQKQPKLNIQNRLEEDGKSREQQVSLYHGLSQDAIESHNTRKNQDRQKAPITKGPASEKSSHQTRIAGEELDEESPLRMENQYLSFQQLPTLKWLTSASQAHQNYLFFEIETGIFILDQHAAHERINLEKTKQAFKENLVKTQKLLVPLKFTVPVAEVEFILSSLSELERYYFKIEYVGENEFQITAVPSLIEKIKKEEIIDMAHQILEFHKTDYELKEEEIVNYIACHSSLRSGDEIWTRGKIKQLLHALDQCQNPHFCAHGRPTYIIIDKNELERRFHRQT